MYFETSITLQNIIYYETEGVLSINYNIGLGSLSSLLHNILIV